MCFILVKVILDSRLYYIKLFFEIGVSHRLPVETCIDDQVSSDSDNGGSAGKESVCNAGDAKNGVSIPGSRRSLGGENGNPL